MDWINFQQRVCESPQPVIVEVGSDDCTPCVLLKPVLRSLERDHPEWKFLRIDALASPDIVDAYGIKSIPTIFRFDGGTVTARVSGYKTKHTLLKALMIPIGEMNVS